MSARAELSLRLEHADEEEASHRSEVSKCHSVHMHAVIIYQGPVFSSPQPSRSTSNLPQEVLVLPGHQTQVQ